MQGTASPAKPKGTQSVPQKSQANRGYPREADIPVFAIPQAKQPRPAASTYSDHIAMEEGIRTEFFAKIEEAIQKHGGEIRLYDTIDLELARKP